MLYTEIKTGQHIAAAGDTHGEWMGTEALTHNSHIAPCTADCSFQIIHSDTGLNYKCW